MSLKRLLIMVLAVLSLTVYAFAEEYVPSVAATQWSPEDFNGNWHIFYRIDDGAASNTKESVFQISLAIDGETAVNTFTFPDGESVTNCTFDCSTEKVTLTYEDGNTADVTLLEDGILQLHMEASEISPETYMYFEKTEP